MSATEPRWHGVPVKWISLVVLLVQNATFVLLLHQSRTRAAPYNAAAAVLTCELLKLAISFAVAWRSYASTELTDYAPLGQNDDGAAPALAAPAVAPSALQILRQLRIDIFSPDSWKLGIPAALYVLQNNLMFVAGANLDVGTYQVSYQLKILTTALFSVWLLKRTLSGTQWLSLGVLTIGVAIVQVSAIRATEGGRVSVPSSGHVMHPLIGFIAVCAACTTSGAAGVYFELVLKSTPANYSPQRQKADLWVRNCQLAFFSLLPAAGAILVPDVAPGSAAPSGGVFANFGLWAWSVILCQVLGGLVTALVIKYSDNIAKGFATSGAIVLSSLAGAVLFGSHLTLLFMLGTAFVIGATWLYAMPPRQTPPAASSPVGAVALPLEPVDAKFADGSRA